MLILNGKIMNQYNLKGIYKDIWTSLELAVVDRHSGFHTFSLATVNNDTPENRTVVLRGCNKKAKMLSFNTNNSSDKVNHISKHNRVSALFYDKDKKIQIRFIGDASINHGNSYCQKKWESMSKQSKECYYQNINPGDTIDSPDLVKSEIKEEISSSFSIIDINIIKIDWLHLSSLGHTRAKFTKENNFQGEWIAP